MQEFHFYSDGIYLKTYTSMQISCCRQDETMVPDNFKRNLHRFNMKKVEHIQLFAFAFNPKSFAIDILVFFLFFLLVQFYGRTAKSFLANVLRLVIKKVRDRDLTYSLNTPKNISVEIVPQVVIRDSCGT